MSSWIWLNTPLCAIVFIATAGISMWVVWGDGGRRKHGTAGGGHPPRRRRADYELAF
jgi:uncharacterized membrane protein